MRRVLIKPMTFLNHFEGAKGLLGLVIVVELPGQIGSSE